MSLDEVQGFFERYRDAFDRLDGDAVAALWHGQGSGIADSNAGCGRLTWWPGTEPMRANHRALCEVYRRSGYGRAEFHIDQHVPMGDDHAFVRVHWTLLGRDGRVLQRFGTGYQLLRGEQGPCVLLCTAYQEDLQALPAADD